MPHVLIAFASGEGHTRKIAQHITGRLMNAGVRASLFDINAPGGPLPRRFDASILAGAVHYGRHGDDLIRFVRDHHETLNARPSLFLSVSLSAAGDDPTDLAGARTAIGSFLLKTWYKPSRTEMIAGGVHLSKTPWLRRQALKLALKRKGVEIPASGEIDYTDWAALDALIDDFLPVEAA